MSVKFLPSELLEKAAPEAAVKRLVTSRLTLNRAALITLSRMGVLSKKTLTKVALKVIKGYKETYGEERSAGASKSEALQASLNDKKLMVSRVQNAAVHEIAQEIKDRYEGEFYEWLPSDAEEPDPEHQLNYGSTFQVGVGEQPGDRYGCRCGMNILVNDDTLEL